MRSYENPLKESAEIRPRNALQSTEALQYILRKMILLMKIIFRLMLLGGITIIVIAFYMRIYCHDHTSLSTQTPNRNNLSIN
jgi:hypothetical protein